MNYRNRKETEQMKTLLPEFTMHRFLQDIRNTLEMLGATEEEVKELIQPYVQSTEQKQTKAQTPFAPSNPELEKVRRTFRKRVIQEPEKLSEQPPFTGILEVIMKRRV